MEHKIGKIEVKRILGKEVCIYHQAPIRYYYRTRNLLFMIKDYKNRDLIIKNIKSLVKDFVKLFFEEKKFIKLKMICLGFSDGIFYIVNGRRKNENNFN